MAVDHHAPNEEERRRRYLNVEAYAARLAAYEQAYPNYIILHYLVEALEGAMTPVRGAPDTVNEDPLGVDDISYKVIRAALWMIQAAHRIYGQDREITEAAGPLWRLPKKERIRLRRKFRGTAGYCPERWQLWKGRFALIRDTDGVEEEARFLAGKAHKAMVKQESKENQDV